MAANRDDSFPGKDDVIAGQVRELIKLFNESDMSELRVEQGDLKLYIARQHASVAGQAQPEADPPAEGETPTDQSFIIAPMVGRFYLAAPGRPPLVVCGHPIAKGQKICIVESMKMPHDILAEIDGLVEEILCEDGQAVEYGQSLFRVRLQPPASPVG
ncbi:MAG: acetyl-CoA carboxylase biotin carboxyl carrier protein subunit [Dehalococcoidia bacterium]|nr:acetyl-CoA carboxylase biotin carboxyl carrier protein subunit [Dehalococcoidia bacterium]